MQKTTVFLQNRDSTSWLTSIITPFCFLCLFMEKPGISVSAKAICFCGVCSYLHSHLLYTFCHYYRKELMDLSGRVSSKLISNYSKSTPPLNKTQDISRYWSSSVTPRISYDIFLIKIRFDYFLSAVSAPMRQNGEYPRKPFRSKAHPLRFHIDSKSS